ncbi:PHD and RING finger domain-containing protein 1 isoform X3 [Solea solea]|uniref:PHD and RING finger domain-containing protein 1 isoform X3 n=1 Tax=Solea solea TaxID=90069 RepID=UPI00272C710D|nr:PHD and RING finger domain-containing protein 1 isoform X3 [Solea solea]
MDEDDNQDELINRSKGKRAAQWVISDSDDDDDVEEESEEGESDEDHLDGEDNEEVEEEEEEGSEEEDDDEEDEDAKPEDGAVVGTSADLAGLSSDEDSDKCPICLNSFSSQPVATPETCEHYFCLDCILEWATNANSCPVDRIAFNSIYLRKCYGGKVMKMITVQKPVKEGQEETVDLDLEQTNCEVCGGSDREDRLLLCDGCDAGYHMECLTPPLDAVPVEEWFCPECEVSNRHLRDMAEEVGDAESLPSTARAATSHRHHQSRTPGPTRAIARTQQSERVRANVNRHRITQLAPTYLIQSSWLDETINAVVAGLNTAVYVRDLTPRAPSRRVRRTVKRRRVKSKTTSFAKGKTGKSATTGVKRRRRRVRRTKSRKKLMVKKTAGPRGRIASNLGIVKDKKNSSLPTVYRPSENTLSNMRADIGAASLSIYGDPSDLDPFVEREENQRQVHVTSLLEAKRRGISRSALRSHQPVARPVTASLSRGGMDVPRSGGGGGGAVEAAPVPDLLGSILSGQSMLLMDSSDVIINRDGSLKATKSTVTPSAVQPSSSKSSSSGDADAQIIPEMSPVEGDSSLSLHYNRDLPGSSHSAIHRPLSQSTACSPPHTSSSLVHTKPPPYTDLPPRGHPRLQPPRPVRPPISSGHHETNQVGSPRDMFSSSIHQTQPKKAPTKPMWVDVSVLPRIPKIRRESSSVTNDGTSQDGSSRIHGSKGNGSDSTCRNNDYGMPNMGMNSLAGDKGRQQGVDQQKGRVDGQTQRHRSGGASSSPAFSNSFASSSSSSSSSTDSPAVQPHCSSSSSSSVSFRINSSGNSWQSRRLNIASPSSESGGNVQDIWKRRQDEARKRQLHRDKQKLLASRTPIKKEQDSNSIYDPFNPTASDSSSSDDETESSSRDKCFRQVKREVPSLGNEPDLVQNEQDLIHVKMEMQETEVSQEQPRRPRSLENISQEVRCSEEYVKVEKESTEVDTNVEKLSPLDMIIKKEPGLDDTRDAERCGHSVNMYPNSGTPDATQPAHHSLAPVKTERDTQEEERVQSEETRVSSSTCKKDSSASSSVHSKKKHMTESNPASTSKSPSRDLGHKKKTSKASKEQHSSSSAMGRGRRGDHHTSDQGSSQKEKDKDKERSSRRSRSRERRRARSTSQSSLSSSPGRGHKKRRQSRSRSQDRKQSRSGSRSSSREHSRQKKNTQRSKESNDNRETDHKKECMSKDKKRGRSRSKSRSRSRSTSRSKDVKRGRSHSKSRSRSRSKERRKDLTQKPSLSHRDKVGSQGKDKRRFRSRSSSRERRKEESKSSQKPSGSRVSSSKDKTQLKDKKKEKEGVHSSVKEENIAKGNKHEIPSCSSSFSKVKKEGKDLKADVKPTAADLTREGKIEIKKEKKSSLDMFEESPISKLVKKEEIDIFSLPETKSTDREDIKGDPIKTQMCEIKTETCEIAIKSEPSSPKLSHSPSFTSFSISSTPVTAECLQDAASQTHSGFMASEERPNPVKQEVLQPSDSDDDFNVDAILDNLDDVKSERTDAGDTFVKQEKEVEEGKSEGAQALAAVGVKSKTQVKRVTWNIQEPEASQSEKSASKVALYKLKRRQEGARRPSSMVHTSGQEMTGSVGDSSEKGAVAMPIASSCKSDERHPEGLSATEQGEAEEGDKSMKDKQYLKKLHMQERAVEEVKLAIKPFYQRRDINKEEYKEILRKAVQKVCHSKSGEINPVKVGNLVKAYVDKYKHARKFKKGEESEKEPDVQTEAMKMSDSP